MSVPEPFTLMRGPTPVQRLPRLERELGFAPGMLWAKRDDLTGFAAGGNKVRKLEFLLGDALARGCDVLVTGGGVQSNHVRTTAAAASVAGLRCVGVLGGTVSGDPEGNAVLDAVFGTELIHTEQTAAEAIETCVAETTLRLAEEGFHPYEIPLGGATDVGTLGYLVAAAEIASQAPMGSVVYTAVGSGGTQAGLVVGLGHHGRVRGVDSGAVEGVAERITGNLIPAVAARAGEALPTGTLQLDTSQVGDGYGAPTDSAREAIVLAGRLEGLILDPVYSAKAMAGLIADRRNGSLAADRPVVFLHTGGAVGLFTARSARWMTEQD